MLRNKFIATPEQLAAKPDLRELLDKVDNVYQEYLANHPEEKSEDVGLLIAGKVAKGWIPDLKNFLVPVKTPRGRSPWNQLVSKRFKGGQKMSQGDMAQIRQEYKELKSGQTPGFDELVQTAQVSNIRASTLSHDADREIFLRHLSKVKALFGYLKRECNAHIAMVYSNDRAGHFDDFGFYANSSIGKLLKERINSGLDNSGLNKKRVQSIFYKMVVRKGQNPDDLIPGIHRFRKASSPFFEDIEVSDGCKGKTKKRGVLEEYIKKSVKALLECHYNKKLPPVNWLEFIDPNRAQYLEPWPRVEGDLVGGRHKLQKLPLPDLKELAISLFKGQIRVVGRSRLPLEQQ
ncbi:hypothetical protein BD560DRAFT_429822 [Blakeslea trispora]|nr:hypothetical protein BD560DRAFT_429822 [Blakeslea trispora]